MSKELYANAAMKAEYESHFKGRCEVWQYLPDSAQQKCIELGRNKFRAIETHHIFHNIGRIDEWSNLICINPVIHRSWGHSSNPIELRVVCLYAKWCKSRDPISLSNPYPESEFNLDELRYCFGQCVVNWLSELERHERLSDDFKKMAMEIIEM